MLRFNLFGFPVAVHWIFWLITALLGGAADASSPLRFQLLLIWIAAVFFSILWHELGHAFMMRHFGDRNVHIMLHGGGGLAFGRSFRTRTEDVIISLAGPLAGLALGGFVWLVDRAFPPHSIYGAVLVNNLLWINIAWSLVNLLPVIPLDGGRISQAVLAGKGALPFKISLVCAAGMAIFAFTQWGSIFVGLMFAVMAMDNWRTLNGRPTSGLMGG